MRIIKENIKKIVLVVLVLTIVLGLSFGGELVASDNLEDLELTLGHGSYIESMFGEGATESMYLAGIGGISPGDYTGGYALVPDGRVYLRIPLDFSKEEVDVVYDRIYLNGVEYELTEDGQKMVDKALSDTGNHYSLYVLFRNSDGTYENIDSFEVQYKDAEGDFVREKLVQDGTVVMRDSLDRLVAAMYDMSKIVDAGDVAKFNSIYGDFDIAGKDSRLSSDSHNIEHTKRLEETLKNLGDIIQEEKDLLNEVPCALGDDGLGDIHSKYVDELVENVLGHRLRYNALGDSPGSVESLKAKSCAKMSEYYKEMNDKDCIGLAEVIEHIKTLDEKANKGENVTLYKSERDLVASAYTDKYEELTFESLEGVKEIDRLKGQLDSYLVDKDNFGSQTHSEYLEVLEELKNVYGTIPCKENCTIDVLEEYEEYKVKGTEAREYCSNKEKLAVEGLLKDNTLADMSSYSDALDRLNSVESQDRLLDRDTKYLSKLHDDVYKGLEDSLVAYGDKYSSKLEELDKFKGCISRAEYEDNLSVVMKELLEISLEPKEFDKDNIVKYFNKYSEYFEYESDVARLEDLYATKFESCSRDYLELKEAELNEMSCGADLEAFKMDVSSRDKSLTVGDLSILLEKISKKKLICDIEDQESILQDLVDSMTCSSDFENIKNTINASNVGDALKAELLENVNSKEYACKLIEVEDGLQEELDQSDCDSDLESLYNKIDSSELSKEVKDKLKEELRIKEETCKILDLEEELKDKVNSTTCSDGYDYIKGLKSEIASSEIDSDLKVDLISKLKNLEDTCKIKDLEDELRDKVKNADCSNVLVIENEVRKSSLSNDIKGELLKDLEQLSSKCVLEELEAIEKEIKDRISKLTCGSDFESLTKDILESKLGEELKTELVSEVKDKKETCKLEELKEIEDNLRSEIANLDCDRDVEDLKNKINTSGLSETIKSELILEIEHKMSMCEVQSELDGSLGRIKDKYVLEKETDELLIKEIEKDLYVDNVVVKVNKDEDGTYTVELSKDGLSVSKSGVVVVVTGDEAEDKEDEVEDKDDEIEDKEDEIEDKDDEIEDKDDEVEDKGDELGDVEDDGIVSNGTETNNTENTLDETDDDAGRVVELNAGGSAGNDTLPKSGVATLNIVLVAGLVLLVLGFNLRYRK